MKKILSFLFSNLLSAGTSPVRFNGRDLYQPGVYSKRDISGAAGGGASGSTALIIGESSEGVPYNAETLYPESSERINWITNISELNDVVVSGDGYDACRIALAPSSESGINGAPLIGFIRINKATQSSLVLENSDSSPADTLDLLSFVFGTNANQVQLKIAAATNDGKKITIKYKDNQSEEQDDITYLPFTISYGGSGSAVALEIDPTTTKTLTTVVTGASDEDLDIDFDSYDTIQSVIDVINNHASGSYTASINDASLLSDDPQKLDAVITADAVDLVTADYQVTAELQACIDFLNKSSYLYVDGVTTSAERRKLENIAFTFMTGATSGTTPIQQDWQDAIDMCQEIDASFIQTVTSDESVHAYLSSHVVFMNGDGKNERQGFAGSAEDDTESTKHASSQAINNMFMDYYGGEAKLFDENGDIKIYPGYIASAYPLGIHAGNDITTPPTNKQLNLVGQKTKWKSSQLDNFIKNGVMVHNQSDSGGTRIVRSVTTYQASNLIANESSMVRTILFITKDLRSWINNKIGVAGDNTQISLIEARARARLDYYQQNNYFVVDPDEGNAYRDFTLEVTGDTYKIEYEGTLVSPVNFILVTHKFVVVG